MSTQTAQASDAVEDALAASIASSAGLDAETVEITRVEEAVGGALDFDLGAAAADVAAAFSDPATRDGIARTSALIQPPSFNNNFFAFRPPLLLYLRLKKRQLWFRMS